MEPYFERLKHVPESDPAVIENREKVQHRMRHDVFGKQYLRTLASHAALRAELEGLKVSTDVNQEEYKILEQDVAYSETKLNNNLTYTFRRLAADLRYRALIEEQFLANIDDELRTLVTLAEHKEELEMLFGASLKYLSVDSFCVAIETGALSSQCLDAIVRNRTKHIEDLAVQAEDKVRTVGKALALAIEENVDDGALPAEAREALSRLKTVQVRVRDLFADLFSGTAGSHEGYGTVYINSGLLHPNADNVLKPTIVHELLHELSGTSTDLLRRVDPTDGWSLTAGTFERKSGLAIFPRNEGTFPRFMWLNEAITEWLTHELLPLVQEGHSADDQPRHKKTYVEEQAKLEELVELGVARQLFLNAYFENMRNDKAASGEHFTALMKRIRELGGENMLARLENKFTLADITSKMRELHAYQSELASLLTERGYPIAVSAVTVRVGTTDDVAVTEVFSFRPTPTYAEREQASLDAFLQNLSHRYGGKVSYGVRDLHATQEEQAR